MEKKKGKVFQEKKKKTRFEKDQKKCVSEQEQRQGKTLGIRTIKEAQET